MRLKQQKEE